MLPRELPEAMRREAALLRMRYADDRLAALCDAHAKDLEEAFAREDNEALGLTEAAAESGYSKNHIGRILSENPELNVGRKNAPAIRRKDLPRKPARAPSQHQPQAPQLDHFTRRAVAGAIQRGS